jgi:hypothetical protein
MHKPDDMLSAVYKKHVIIQPLIMCDLCDLADRAARIECMCTLQERSHVNIKQPTWPIGEKDDSCMCSRPAC